MKPKGLFMAIQSGFFNATVTTDSQTGLPVYDRAGTAEQFAHYFSRFIGNGVFMKTSTDFQVLANSGMNLTVKAGDAWINGYYAWADTDETIAIASSPMSNPRIDRIVLRLDLTQSGRAITLAVKQGTEAATPVAPSLTRNAEVCEIALADVTVGVNVSAISQANIADLRLNSSLCGIVTSLVDQVDTTTLYNQIQADLDEFQTVNQADFEAWLESIQGILDEDTAGHLLTLINGLKTEVENHPWVELTPTNGAVSIDTADGSRFHTTLEANLTVNITAKDGDAFCLMVDVAESGHTLTLPNNVELVGELENTAGLAHVINFIRYGQTIMAYVLGKAD